MDVHNTWEVIVPTSDVWHTPEFHPIERHRMQRCVIRTEGLGEGESEQNDRKTQNCWERPSEKCNNSLDQIQLFIYRARVEPGMRSRGFLKSLAPFQFRSRY